MRLSIIIQALTCAVVVNANSQLLADYQTLLDLDIQLTNTLASWSGTFMGLLPIIGPTVLQGSQLLRILVDIEQLTSTLEPLSEQEADQILQAIEAITKLQPTFTGIIVGKKDALISLSPGLGNFVAASCTTLRNLTARSQDSLLKAMPADKKEELLRYWNLTQQASAEVDNAYKEYDVPGTQ
jgi:hypothetical protein